MKVFQQTCFDDYVVGTAAVFSPAVLDPLLGRFDWLAVHVLADKVGGTSPRVTLALEHSADSRRWLDKNEVPIVSSQSLTAGTINSFAGGDDSGVASLAYVRLRINLEGTGPRARVRVIVCGRGKAVYEVRLLGDSEIVHSIAELEHEARGRPRRSRFAAAALPAHGALGRPVRPLPRRVP